MSDIEGMVRDGSLAVTATADDGCYGAVTSRQEFYAELLRFRTAGRKLRKAFVRRVGGTLREFLSNPPPGGWSPSNDRDFMADIVLAMALRLVDGDDILRYAGLKDIRLEVLADPSLPDEERGLLPEWLERSLGMDTRAVDRDGAALDARTMRPLVVH